MLNFSNPALAHYFDHIQHQPAVHTSAEKLSHSRNYRNPLRDVQVGAPFYSFLGMDVPLASNIIDSNYPLLR